MASLPAALSRHLDGYCDVATADHTEPYARLRELVPSVVPVTQLLRDGLGPYLTHSDGRVRSRATVLLAQLLADCGPSLFGDTDATQRAVAATLLEFCCGRLADSPR